MYSRTVNSTPSISPIQQHLFHQLILVPPPPLHPIKLNKKKNSLVPSSFWMCSYFSTEESGKRRYYKEARKGQRLVYKSWEVYRINHMFDIRNSFFYRHYSILTLFCIQKDLFKCCFIPSIVCCKLPTDQKQLKYTHAHTHAHIYTHTYVHNKQNIRNVGKVNFVLDVHVPAPRLTQQARIAVEISWERRDASSKLPMELK